MNMKILTSRTITQINSDLEQDIELLIHNTMDLWEDSLNLLLKKADSSKIKVIHLPRFPLGKRDYFTLPEPGYESRVRVNKQPSAYVADIVELLTNKGLIPELYVIHPPYPEKNQEVVNNLLINLEELRTDYNLNVCLENLPFTVFSTPSDVKLFQEKGYEISYVLDTSHVRGDTREVLEFINLMGGSLKHLHLSDKINNKGHYQIGSGELDWNRIINALSDYNGFATIEVRHLSDFKPSVNFLENL